MRINDKRSLTKTTLREVCGGEWFMTNDHLCLAIDNMGYYWDFTGDYDVHDALDLEIVKVDVEINIMDRVVE
jgi:hypothetical protein